MNLFSYCVPGVRQEETPMSTVHKHDLSGFYQLYYLLSPAGQQAPLRTSDNALPAGYHGVFGFTNLLGF